jgi:hypothetical protein
MKEVENIMVIYGQRITELRQELNKNKDSITDLQFILKSPNGKSKTQKYININKNAVQMKERDVEEEIEKMKKQIEKEKEKQKKTTNYVRVISNDINDKKRKKLKRKLRRSR